MTCARIIAVCEQDIPVPGDEELDKILKQSNRLWVYCFVSCVNIICYIVFVLNKRTAPGFFLLLFDAFMIEFNFEKKYFVLFTREL